MKESRCRVQVAARANILLLFSGAQSRQRESNKSVSQICYIGIMTRRASQRLKYITFTFGSDLPLRAQNGIRRRVPPENPLATTSGLCALRSRKAISVAIRLRVHKASLLSPVVYSKLGHLMSPCASKVFARSRSQCPLKAAFVNRHRDGSKLSH